MPTQAARRNLLYYRFFWRCCWIALLILVVNAGASAEEDPYLSAISQEAKKVDAKDLPTPSEEDGTQTPVGDGPSIQAFEEDLKTRYKGSYTFYQKLPRRTQEEIFLEYRDGASIDEIREKIMQRFLHR